MVPVADDFPVRPERIFDPRFFVSYLIHVVERVVATVHSYFPASIDDRCEIVPHIFDVVAKTVDVSGRGDEIERRLGAVFLLQIHDLLKIAVRAKLLAFTPPRQRRHEVAHLSC